MALKGRSQGEIGVEIAIPDEAVKLGRRDPCHIQLATGERCRSDDRIATERVSLARC
jgi:hypothetical protein